MKRYSGTPFEESTLKIICTITSIGVPSREYCHDKLSFNCKKVTLFLIYRTRVVINTGLISYPLSNR